MSGDVTKTVTIEFLMKNGKPVESDMNNITKTMDELKSKGIVATDSVTNVNKSMTRMGKAAGTAAAGVNTVTASLPRMRYALYDVSRTMAIFGAAMLGLGVVAVGTSITMDRKFADVIRTTGTYMDKTGQQTEAPGPVQRPVRYPPLVLERPHRYRYPCRTVGRCG